MTYGIEEEVFILREGKPSPESLFYLSLLLRKRTGFNYSHTDFNFSHLPDISTGIMGGVELSTDVCDSADSVVENLLQRRRELAEVCSDKIVPVGHLFDERCSTRTCGMHIHIGGMADPGKAYKNISFFLPLLMLLTANAPYAGGRYFGCSYRIHACSFIGPVHEDPLYRFQDVIISRRLKTLEMRIFDPVWDISRIKKLIEIIVEIVGFSEYIEFDPAFYNSARGEAVVEGYGKFCRQLYHRLRDFCDVPEELFKRTPSDIVRDYCEENGRDETYAALDNAYRGGDFKANGRKENKQNVVKIVAGIGGYLIPRLPYSLWKACRETG